MALKDIISLGSEQDEMVTNQALADKKRETYLRRQSVCTLQCVQYTALYTVQSQDSSTR